VQPWRTIESVATAEGRLDLRQRGDRSFLITISGRVLMTSEAHRSEKDLARLACAAMGDLARPNVLIAGLGMGYTLRAALDCLPQAARITVVELNPAVVAWCAGPLARLTNSATSDERVTTVVGDVARVVANARPGTYDAIVLDLYEGPYQANNHAYDPLFGTPALKRTAAALKPGGVLAVWSEEPSQAFEDRAAIDFQVERHRGAGGGRRHVIYVAKPAIGRPRFASRPLPDVRDARRTQNKKKRGVPKDAPLRRNR
jgi:spermidine synthase